MSEKAKSPRTTYVVLVQRRGVDDSPADPEGDTLVSSWHECGTLEAASADAAIKAHVAKTGETGRYVAVPARSFAPQHVTVETKTTVKIGGNA